MAESPNVLEIKLRTPQDRLNVEAMHALRELRRVYYDGSRYWGQLYADRTAAYWFERAFERVMATASPEFQAAVMAGGPHSPACLGPCAPYPDRVAFDHACDVAGCDGH